MKTPLFLISAFCLVQIPLHAQVTVVTPTPAPAGVVVVQQPSAVVVQQPSIVVRTLDPVVIQRQLSLPPKVVIVTPTPAPQTAVKTTKTTTVVDTPGRARRVYNSERSVVLVEVIFRRKRVHGKLG